MKGPISFMLGWSVIEAEPSQSAKIMSICLERSLYCTYTESENGNVLIECSLYTAKKLLAICREEEIEIISHREKGLPMLLGRYRRRYGIFVGALCMCLIIFFSGRVLWDIRIDGEKRLSESEVKALLYECGLYVGEPLKSIKSDVISNRALILSDDISWMSVNLIGTVAHVQIRETQSADEKPEYSAANLVADDDGEIVFFEEVRGNIITEIGDYVNRGDLLVSGLYDESVGGFRYEVAEGRVMARTERDFSIEIPLRYERKVYTERSYCEKYIIFFNKEIKIFSNSRNLPQRCDTIDTKEYINVFGDGRLPFGIRTVKHLEYTSEEASRTPEEALRLAMYRLRRDEAEDGILDVLRRDFSYDLTDDSYTLSCKTVCIKNIARQVEIEIAESKKR